MRMLRYCARVFVSLSDRGARALVCLHQGVHGFRHRGLTCRPVAQHIPRCPSDPIRPWRPGLGGHVRGAGGRARRALPGHRGAAPAAAHVRAGWRRIRTAGGRRRGRGRVPRRRRRRLRPGGRGRAWVGCARAPCMRRPCAAAPCAQCYGWPCARGVPTGCNVSNLICAIAPLVCASLSGSEAARRAPAALTPAPARARLHESLLAPRASGAARRRPGRAGQRRPEADRACAGGPGGPAGPALGHLLTGARLAAAGCAGAGQDRVRLTTPGVSRPSGSLNQSRARFCDRRDPSFPGGPAWAGLAAYVKSARGGRHSCAPARSMSAMWQRWSSGRASRRSVLQ